MKSPQAGSTELQHRAEPAGQAGAALNSLAEV